MAQFEKWIEGVSADDSTREAAQHSLRARLSAVKGYLPLAAHRAEEDVEHVHQLRVCTRRSMAAAAVDSGCVEEVDGTQAIDGVA